MRGALHIVGIGGGTGLSALLRGLREVSESDTGDPRRAIRISAIVCVADSGGSSGVLRELFGMPAVGDIRNCLAALCHGSSGWPDLLAYRFPAGDGLRGHSLGNLMLASLWHEHGTLGAAVEKASGLLGLEHCVLPATEAESTLCAEFEDGSLIRGEARIAARRRSIQRIWLEPANPPAAGGVIEAIDDADVIVLGPGSLYTSIVPNLLVTGIGETVRRSSALKVFVCNLVTEKGETEGFTAADHLRVLTTYLRPGGVDICILNSRSARAGHLRHCQEAGSAPVVADYDQIRRLGAMPVETDLLSESESQAGHDAGKLAQLILLVAQEAGGRQTSYQPQSLAA